MKGALLNLSSPPLHYTPPTRPSPQLTFWIATSCVAVALVVYNTLSDKRYYDGNLYFTEKKAWSPAMKALVLNAGKLDEVSWDPRETTPCGRELSSSPTLTGKCGGGST